MHVGKKYRGNMEHCLIEYVHNKLEGRDDIDLRRAFITHSGSPDSDIKMVLKEVKKLQKFKEIYITRTNCTISTHCGPQNAGRCVPDKMRKSRMRKRRAVLTGGAPFFLRKQSLHLLIRCGSHDPRQSRGLESPRRASYRQASQEALEKSVSCITCPTARKRALFI